MLKSVQAFLRPHMASETYSNTLVQSYDESRDDNSKISLNTHTVDTDRCDEIGLRSNRDESELHTEHHDSDGSVNPISSRSVFGFKKEDIFYSSTIYDPMKRRSNHPLANNEIQLSQLTFLSSTSKNNVNESELQFTHDYEHNFSRIMEKVPSSSGVHSLSNMRPSKDENLELQHVAYNGSFVVQTKARNNYIQKREYLSDDRTWKMSSTFDTGKCHFQYQANKAIKSSPFANKVNFECKGLSAMLQNSSRRFIFETLLSNSSYFLETMVPVTYQLSNSDVNLFHICNKRHLRIKNRSYDTTWISESKGDIAMLKDHDDSQNLTKEGVVPSLFLEADKFHWKYSALHQLEKKNMIVDYDLHYHHFISPNGKMSCHIEENFKNGQGIVALHYELDSPEALEDIWRIQSNESNDPFDDLAFVQDVRGFYLDPEEIAGALISIRSRQVGSDPESFNPKVEFEKTLKYNNENGSLLSASFDSLERIWLANSNHSLDPFDDVAIYLSNSELDVEPGTAISVLESIQLSIVHGLPSKQNTIKCSSSLGLEVFNQRFENATISGLALNQDAKQMVSSMGDTILIPAHDSEGTRHNKISYVRKLGFSNSWTEESIWRINPDDSFDPFDSVVLWTSDIDIDLEQMEIIASLESLAKRNGKAMFPQPFTPYSSGRLSQRLLLVDGTESTFGSTTESYGILGDGSQRENDDLKRSILWYPDSWTEESIWNAKSNDSADPFDDVVVWISDQDADMDLSAICYTLEAVEKRGKQSLSLGSLGESENPSRPFATYKKTIYDSSSETKDLEDIWQIRTSESFDPFDDVFVFTTDCDLNSIQVSEALISIEERLATLRKGVDDVKPTGCPEGNSTSVSCILNRESAGCISSPPRSNENEHYIEITPSVDPFDEVLVFTTDLDYDLNQEDISETLREIQNIVTTNNQRKETECVQCLKSGIFATTDRDREGHCEEKISIEAHIEPLSNQIEIVMEEMSSECHNSNAMSDFMSSSRKSHRLQSMKSSIHTFPNRMYRGTKDIRETHIHGVESDWRQPLWGKLNHISFDQIFLEECDSNCQSSFDSLSLLSDHPSKESMTLESSMARRSLCLQKNEPLRHSRSKQSQSTENKQDIHSFSINQDWLCLQDYDSDYDSVFDMDSFSTSRFSDYSTTTLESQYTDLKIEAPYHQENF